MGKERGRKNNNHHREVKNEWGWIREMGWTERWRGEREIESNREEKRRWQGKKDKVKESQGQRGVTGRKSKLEAKKYESG